MEKAVEIQGIRKLKLLNIQELYLQKFIMDKNMPYIPKAVCEKCRVPLQPYKNDVTCHCYSAAVRWYYSISADLWKCPLCGIEVITGFATKPFKMNFETNNEKPATPWTEERNIYLEGKPE